VPGEKEKKEKRKKFGGENLTNHDKNIMKAVSERKRAILRVDRTRGAGLGVG